MILVTKEVLKGLAIVDHVIYLSLRICWPLCGISFHTIDALVPLSNNISIACAFEFLFLSVVFRLRWEFVKFSPRVFSAHIMQKVTGDKSAALKNETLFETYFDFMLSYKVKSNRHVL